MRETLSDRARDPVRWCARPRPVMRETLTIVREPLFSARRPQSFRAKNGRVVVDTPRGEW